jgi:predicted DNA-binding ribbon-helix-helix protein
MCQMFAGQDPARYEYVTRRLRLNGQSTSIRLERAFWGIVDQMAAKDGTFDARLPVQAAFRSAGTAGRGDEFHLASALCLHDPSGRARPGAATRPGRVAAE